MELREYQSSAVNQIKQEFKKGNKKVILQAATGAGKTIMFSFIAEATAKKKRKVLIITDRKELLTQAGNKIKESEYLDANTKILPTSQIVVSMSETLKRRLKKQVYIDFLNTFNLIIIDEAHKASFDRISEIFTDNQYVIGATATPYRTGKMTPLSKFYDNIVSCISIKELIAKEFLSKPKYFGVKVDLKGVKTTAGEYNPKQLSQRYEEIKLYDGVISNYEKHTPNTKTLVFSATIENSIKLCNEFIKKGYKARHLDSNMSDIERNSILSGYADGTIKILCNVGILTTGFDSPDTETVILYRATKSLPLFLQMIGRGSRTTETKKTFTVLDFGNNIERHGFWHEDKVWSLDIPKKRKSENQAELKECPKCFELLYLSAKKCNSCGYVYPKPKKTKMEIMLSELKSNEINHIVDSGVLNIVELEELRVLKNYKIGWLLHKLNNLEEYKKYAEMKNYKPNWANYQFNKFR